MVKVNSMLTSDILFRGPESIAIGKASDQG